MAMMDDLKSMGCNISVNTTWDGFLVQLTLMHGDQMCGHNGRGIEPKYEDAVKRAVANLVRAAKGSKCGVEIEPLEKLLS